MTKISTPENGKPTGDNNPIENAKIEFPVTFKLKAVMDNSYSEEENKKKIISVLSDLKIKNNFIDLAKSSKGTYTSYHYQITLISKPQMETLYENLKNIPGLKLAI